MEERGQRECRELDPQRSGGDGGEEEPLAVMQDDGQIDRTVGPAVETGRTGLSCGSMQGAGLENLEQRGPDLRERGPVS